MIHSQTNMIHTSKFNRLFKLSLLAINLKDQIKSFLSNAIKWGINHTSQIRSVYYSFFHLLKV